MRQDRIWLGAISLFLGLAVAVVPAASEEPAVEDEEEVVVTAQRRKETRTEVPASISVITRREIERSIAQNLVDLLVREPGVFVSRQGGLGYGGSIQVRGLGGNPPVGSLVLIDGHPDFMGIMGHSMPSAYLVDHVERVEILRGPASTLYGTNAAGGLIHIVTRRPEGEGASAQVWAETGSFGTRNMQGRVGTAMGRFSAAFMAGHRETDGHLPNGYGRYQASNYALNAWQQWAPGVSTRFTGSVVRYDTIDQRALASAYWAGTPIPRLRQEFNRRDFGITTEWAGERRDSSLSLYYNPSEHRFEDGFHSTDVVGGLSWTQRFHGSETIRGAWGLDLQRYGGEVKSPAPSAGHFARSEGGVYATVERCLERGERVSAGLRVQSIEGFRTQWLPSVGAVWPLGEGAARASLRSGFRTPSFRELFLFGTNNPRLQPERTWQAEVGYHHATERGEVDLALFHTRASQLIQLGARPADLPGKTPVAFVNLPVARLYGAELGLRRQLTPSLSGYFNYSLLDPGEACAYNAEHKVNLGADYSWGRLRLATDIQWLDRIWGVDAQRQTVRLPGFWLVGLKATYAINRDYEAWLGVDNLFDKAYTLDPSFPYAMPGRALYAGVRART